MLPTVAPQIVIFSVAECVDQLQAHLPDCPRSRLVDAVNLYLDTEVQTTLLWARAPDYLAGLRFVQTLLGFTLDQVRALSDQDVGELEDDHEEVLDIVHDFFVDQVSPYIGDRTWRHTTVQIKGESFTLEIGEDYRLQQWAKDHGKEYPQHSYARLTQDL